MNNFFYRMYFKRFFDIFFSLVFLLVLSPLLISISLLIKFTSKGGVIFWSERVGKDCINFYMPKFRTMRLGTPNVATHLMSDPDDFITPVGTFLRKTSIDELPQLLSILRGSMSFVGPRPALFNQNDLISQRKYSGIHILRPGLTGWAQVNGRDELSIVDKVQYDLEYLERYSIWFDIYIVALTFILVIRRVGVSH